MLHSSGRQPLNKSWCHFREASFFPLFLSVSFRIVGLQTINASRHPNMKELRFNADDGVWRVAFAFDPERSAVLLVAADKSGKKERLFYRRLIKLADERFGKHLNRAK